jgi:hypothetical protein
VFTAQNTRNALVAITEVPEEQLLQFSDSEDDYELQVCGEGSSEGEGNVLGSFTDRKNDRDKTSRDPNTRRSLPNCPFCLHKGREAMHWLVGCKEFKALKAAGMYDACTVMKLCYNCFLSEHIGRLCPAKAKCKECTYKHHSYLHRTDAERKASKHKD